MKQQYLIFCMLQRFQTVWFNQNNEVLNNLDKKWISISLQNNLLFVVFLQNLNAYNINCKEHFFNYFKPPLNNL